MSTRALCLIVALLPAGCLGAAQIAGGGDEPGETPGSTPGMTPAEGGLVLDHEAMILAPLPKGAELRNRLCARGHSDSVARAVCASAAPAIGSLVELEQAVGLFAEALPPQLALLSHSTSLVGAVVSAANPRAIIFTPPNAPPSTQANDGSRVADPGFVALAFTRGAQVVEIAAHDAQKNEIHFYLARFTQDCNKVGCNAADRLGPGIESNWRSLEVYEDVELTNTVLDCTSCHQPGGSSSRKMLRMQELRAPWTHWLRNNTNEPGGMALLDDFRSVHPADEPFAGIPGNLLGTPRVDPALLEALVTNNSVSPQPNEFPSAQVETQVRQSAPQQPEINDPPGRSTAWQTIYGRAVAGQAIPVPYHDVKVTDSDKLAAYASAYRSVITGKSPASALPPVEDLFLDSALPEMGRRPRAGLDGQGILVQMCATCHNGQLDPALGKSRFDVTRLSSLSRAVKDLAITRLRMPHDAIAVMPPIGAAELSQAEIDAAVAALQQ